MQKRISSSVYDKFVINGGRYSSYCSCCQREITKLSFKATKKGISLSSMDDNFPKWLSTELEKRTWSMRELGRRAQISHSWVADVVSGAKPASWEFCAAIAKPLRLSPIQLFVIAGLIPIAEIKAMAATADSQESDARLIALIEVVKELPVGQREVILDSWETTLRVAGLTIDSVPITLKITEGFPELSPVENAERTLRLLKRRDPELYEELMRETEARWQEDQTQGN